MTSGPTPEGRPVIGEIGVRRIAELARLRVEPEEIPALAEHFERMLDFAESLQEVDVEGVEPDLHPDRQAEFVREDRVLGPNSPGSRLDRSAVLANAPDHEGPYFTTPRVV